MEVLASVNSSSLCIRTNWRSWENCKFGLPLFPLRISFVGYNRSLRKDFQAFKKEHCQRAVCSASVAGYIGLDSELMPRGWSNCTLMEKKEWISLEMHEQGSHRNSRLSLLDFFLHIWSGEKKTLSYEFCTESNNLQTDGNKLDLVMQAGVLIEWLCRLEAAMCSLLSDIRKLELQW